MKRFAYVLAVLCPWVLAACGDNVRTYRATLTPLNGNVTGTPTGTVEFTINEDEDVFATSLSAVGLDDVPHAQHIHSSTACPTASADANGDGFVDVVEGVPAYGAILLPLDNNLANAMPNDFPQGSAITYSQTAKLGALLTELRKEDTNPNDAVTTLGANGELNLAQRTVVVHGVSDDVPASVASIGNLPAKATLPVMCGTLEEVD